MKIIFMGTPEFAVPALRKLVAGEHEVVAVYTQPPRPAGRGHKLRKSPIHELAEAHNIPAYTPRSLKSPEEQQKFADIAADIAVVAAYGLLLPPPILEACPHGCINIHPSLLPRWRGAAPIQRTIMAGDRKTGVCIMQMDEGLDTGDILLQREYDIPDGTNAGGLHDVLAEMGAEMIPEVLKMIGDGQLSPVPQAGDGVTYAKKISKQEAHIDWNNKVEDIRNMILGLSPYPGAYFIHNDKKIKILDADIGEEEDNSEPAGTVINDDLTIKCKEGVILPLLLQRSGKKPMPTQSFLRGYKISPGNMVQ